MTNEELYKELSKLKDEQIKFRRTMKDTLLNLDGDNFPGFAKTVKLVTETKNNLATLQGTVNGQGSAISAIVSSEIVEGETVYKANASLIITAINGQSAAKINADLIQMTGTTTFVKPGDLGSGGTTTIYGDRIRLGSLISNNYSEFEGVVLAGTKFNLGTGEILSKNFKIDSSGNATFSGAISASSGSIDGRLYFNEDQSSFIGGYTSDTDPYISINSDKLLIYPNGQLALTEMLLKSSSNALMGLIDCATLASQVAFATDTNINLNVVPKGNLILSVMSGKTMYIGQGYTYNDTTQLNPTNTIYMGNANSAISINGTINLNGSVYINGVLQ